MTKVNQDFMKKYIFSTDIKVRDYELDAEGIVNNANYLHYLEYTRHCFCEHAGYSFNEMSKDGIIPILNRVEVDYKTPLKSGDTMESKLWLENQGVRFIFHQDIFNKATKQPVVNAVASIVCLKNGKINRGEKLAEIFKEFLS